MCGFSYLGEGGREANAVAAEIFHAGELSLKDNIKIYIKITSEQLRHVSVQLRHHQGAMYFNGLF